MSVLTEILIGFAPLLIFLAAMIIIYFRGSKTNEKLSAEIETAIMNGLEPYSKEIKKVKIRPDEYEFRCVSKNKNIRVLTAHMKLVNRSFIIQWLINLLFKERERVFIGLKFGGPNGEDEPSYRFDVVPYRKKSFIRARWEVFREIDDIPTTKKEVDNQFMIKAESQAYVEHFVQDEHFVELLYTLEPFMEHMVLQKSKEETDPHYAVTFEFYALKDEYNITSMLELFFLGAILHISNHEEVRKKIAKGSRGKSMTSVRGSARRGAGKRKQQSRKSKKSKSAKKKKN